VSSVFGFTKIFKGNLVDSATSVLLVPRNQRATISVLFSGFTTPLT
jgi:hypothetical protein